MSLAESKHLRDILHVLLIFSLLTALSGYVSAVVELDNVKVQVENSGDEIDVGETLDLTITYEDPSEDESNAITELEILIDGIQVHYEDELELDFSEGDDLEYTISSSSFKDEDNNDVWEKNLMDHDCGSHTIEVLVGGDDLENYEDEIEFDIDGKELTFEMDPENPGIDTEITVTVWDDDGDELRSTDIKLTWIDDPDGIDDDEWDDDDQKWTGGRTDSDGEETFDIESHFDDEAYGKYQMDVYKSNDYCKETTTFEVSNTLTISVTPEGVDVGDDVNICVKDQSGNNVYAASLLVYKPAGGYSQTYSTATSGCKSISFSSPGTYSISATKTGYEENLDGEIIVSEKGSLTVTPSVTPVSSGKTITIMVKSSGQAVSGATVKVKKDGGTQQTLSGTTNSNGEISYTVGDSGSYMITAEHESYTSGTNTFRVENSFEITVPQSPVTTGSNAEITVRDAQGDAVSGASISISQANINGKTDSQGRFRFIIPEPGAFNILVEKQGYASKSVVVDGQGQLKVLVEPATAEIGTKAKVTVTDTKGMTQPATLTITKPSGTKATAVASIYDLSVEEIGEYMVKVEKSYYVGAQTTFQAVPKALSVNGMIEEGLLKLNATSKGQAVAGLTLNVALPNRTVMTVQTNEYGIAALTLAGSGNYTITSVSKDFIPVERVVMNSGSLVGGTVIKLFLILIILLIVILLVVGTISIIGGKAKGLGGKPKKPKYERGKGSKLGGGL